MLARKNLVEVPEWYQIDRARAWIVKFYEAWDKPTKAAKWKQN